MTDTLFLAEITAYDASISGTRVLRYASGLGFVTGPAETPSSTFYDGKITQPSDLTRDLFDSGTTLGRSRVGFGDLVLANDDGTLDGLLEYAFDGWPITIRQGTVGAAYPAGFPAVFVGTMEQAEVSASAVTIKLRDRQAETDVPFQPTKYAGTNALPAGVEGVATDLKGKPKPIVMGSVSNVAPPCVNTSKLIYQVSDGAISAVSTVYDRGVALGTSGRRWVRRTSPFGTTAVTGFAYGSGTWVGVAGQGGGTPGVATSPDGITWTLRATPFAVGDTPVAVAFGNGVFVQIANNAAGTAGLVATSPDGITWTLRVIGIGLARNVTWASEAGLFVIVGGAIPGPAELYTSPTGVTWTVRTSGVTAVPLRSVVAAKGVIVAAGDQGTITTSTDGITWTLRTTGATNTFFRALVYHAASGLFIGGGTGGLSAGIPGGMSVSSDGFTWTRLVGPPSLNGCFGLASDGTTVVMVGSTNYLASSTDGVTWVEQLGVFTGGTVVGAVAFGNGSFVAGGASGAAGSVYSTEATPFASLVELENDLLAPAAGTFTAYPAGGYFRLGSTPAGQITADVVEGTAASDRTAAQCFKRALVRAGKSASDYSASDLTALDALTTDVLGLYVDEETTLSDVLTRIAASVGAWWGVDKAGVFRIQQFRAPTTTPVATFTANDLKRPLDRQATNDIGGGLPVFKSIVRWGRKYTVQTTDLAGSVTDTRRAELAKEWREASATVASVQTAHPLSPQLVEDSLLTTEAAAQAEATRRQALRGVRRDRYPIVVALDSTTSLIDLNDVVELMHARFDLMAVGESGKLFRVIGVQPDAKNREVTFVLWGPSQGLQNRITDTGAYRVTDTGAYRITAAE